MPLSVKIGRYTTRMMITPNTLGLMTSRVASRTMVSRSVNEGWRRIFACSSPSRRRQFSTIITAPSTIKPKSRAPRLMRLPDTREPTMPVIVQSIAIGMTAAVTRAARTLPSNANSTAMTSNAPSVRLRVTVAIVASTSEVRS